MKNELVTVGFLDNQRHILQCHLSDLTGDELHPKFYASCYKVAEKCKSKM